MKTQRPFSLLLRIFQNRFFENDNVSPGGGFQTNIHQVLGFLAAIGGGIAYFVMPAFAELSLGPSTPETVWIVRAMRLSFSAFSFGVAGFAAIFYWDMLFPDRRDFLILEPFPIRLRDLIAAKFVALVLFLLLLTAAINAGPDLMVLLVTLFTPKLRGTGIRLVLGQIVATSGASLFAFLSVVAFQGAVINVTSAKLFRRVSPAIQMLGMSLMIVTLLGVPIYSAFLQRGMEKHETWLFLFPPFWFSGLYELFLGGPNQLLDFFATLAIAMTMIAMLTILLTWGLGFRRHFRRTLESEDAPHRPLPWSVPDWVARSPQERAIFVFLGRTLTRSQKHHFFLAAYLSAGLVVAVLFGTAIQNGKLGLSPGGARAVAFVVGFFFITAFRAAFQFPAELSANWIFRMTEARWTELSRRATRKFVLSAAVIPALLLVLPVELTAWHWPVVLKHVVVQFIAGALLVELMFWNFDKVPFTCSYFAGRTSLAVLGVLYIYGITGYSFHLADLEVAIEHSWLVALLFFAGTGVTLVLSWGRRPRPEAVRFDGTEPAIQTLELT